jgi:hypothetical protein
LFVVPSLKPSSYTVTVAKSGFANVEYPKSSSAVGQELSLPVRVQATRRVGKRHGDRGVRPRSTPQTPESAQNVSEREVQGLPVNGRQMSQLMLQAPGSQNAGTGTWAISDSRAAPSSRT